MEDLFDSAKDRWQRSYRYPIYQRHVWVVGVAVLAAAVLLRHRIREIFVSDARIGWAVVAALALVVLWCAWTTFRAWKCKILISPTAIKARLLFSGRQRISWEHMQEVVYKWRPLGHVLVFIGTDGARVVFRSSITGYDEVLDFVRDNAPEHIINQLDEIFGEEEEEDEDDSGGAEESDGPHDSPDGERTQEENTTG